MPERTLDTCGLSCPMPILRAKKALVDMPSGAVLEVLATDPAAPKDFVAFCKATGNTLKDSGTRDKVYWFHIERVPLDTESGPLP